ncbi:hypothetical protein ACKKBG_A32295 [Auxenochlorella protothecoides x Auxenochlorella symbiontica]
MQARAAMAAAAGPLPEGGKPGSGHDGAAPVSETAAAAVSGNPSLETSGKRPRDGEDLAPTGPPKKIKWKKLAAAELNRKGGSMKLKKLTAAVLAAAGRGEDSAAELLQKLESSGRFSLRENRVALVDE